MSFGLKLSLMRFTRIFSAIARISGGVSSLSKACRARFISIKVARSFPSKMDGNVFMVVSYCSVVVLMMIKSGTGSKGFGLVSIR